MNYIISVVLLIAVATASVIHKPPITTIDAHAGSRIISGQPGAPGQFPWQVANIHEKVIGTFFCGGALICDSWVLTAAHCAENVSHFTLYFGSVNQSQAVEAGRVEVETTEKIVHERYNGTSLNHDIALIKLKQKVNFTDKILPIPLSNDYIGVNVELTVSGWGKSIDGSNNVSPILNYVNLTTISNKECEGVYGSLSIINSTLCCRGRPEHSTCGGDSGGPLVQQRPDGKIVHVGVVSFVHRDGCASGNPSGYVRTASYHDWIVKNINGSCKLP